MSGYVQPDEAASALSGIREQQKQVIDAVLVPAWYWWAVAAGMVVIGAATDTRRVAVLAVAIPVAVIIIAALTLGMIFGTFRRAQVRSAELLGNRGALLIVGFVWLVVGLTLGIGFGLRAAGAPEPATIATAIGGAALAAGGPAIMRRLRTIMLANRAGSGR
jgi:FtsH-binding integral membrane protein